MKHYGDDHVSSEDLADLRLELYGLIQLSDNRTSQAVQDLKGTVQDIKETQVILEKKISLLTGVVIGLVFFIAGGIIYFAI